MILGVLCSEFNSLSLVGRAIILPYVAREIQSKQNLTLHQQTQPNDRDLHLIATNQPGIAQTKQI